MFCISWGRHTFNGHTVMIWPGTVREAVTANNWLSLVGYVQPESQKLPGLEGRNWPAVMRCEVKRTLVFRLYLFLRNPKLSKAIPCAFVNLFFDPLALNQLTSQRIEVTKLCSLPAQRRGGLQKILPQN